MRRRLGTTGLLALGLLLSWPPALAGGGAAIWQAVGSRGQLTPARQVQLNRPCPALRLPPTWHVLDAAYADVTGDGQPECVLAVWRPWKDWPTRRWLALPSPVLGNHDAAGLSAQIAVLTPLGGGRYRERWVGSPLYQPVMALSALPDGRLATLETTYLRGPQALSRNLSLWRWTGFGLRLEQRWPLRARQLATEKVTGQVAAR